MKRTKKSEDGQNPKTVVGVVCVAVGVAVD